MKFQVHLTIQSDEGQAEVVHEVARLERGPVRPDTLGLPLAPSALDSGGAGANDGRRASRPSSWPKHGGVPVAAGSARATVTTESCFVPLLVN